MKKQSIAIEIPFPPTLNGLYATNFQTKRRFPSKKYGEWQKKVIPMMQEQAKGIYIESDCVQIVNLNMDRRWYKNGNIKQIDCANYEKAVSDCLVKAGILLDDYLIVSNTQRWSKIRCECLVTLETI